MWLVISGIAVACVLLFFIIAFLVIKCQEDRRFSFLRTDPLKVLRSTIYDKRKT